MLVRSLSLLLALTVLAVLPSRAADKPNVLFLAVDDLNDWIGALGGHPQVKTPNFDRLAKRSVLFTRAYCAAPACNPSRTALLCGKYPATSGVYHNNQPWRPVLKDAVTLPQHFMANGYQVRGGGKIFHNSYNDAASWQEWFREGNNPSPKQLPANGLAGTAHFDWGPVDVDDSAMGDYKVAKWATAFLSQKQDKPFFFAPGFIRPHLPFFAPRKYFDLYPLSTIQLPPVQARDLDDVPEAGRKMAKPDGDHRRVVESKNWEKAVQAYLACITFTDACLGMILDALEQGPNANNTIIVAWSDHGWHLGEKEHWRKFALWERATRVVLMVSAPGVTSPSRCERTVNLVDLYPTLVELGGLPTQSGIEGHSLVPLLKNPASPWNHPSITTHGRNNHAVRSERYRYIRYADGSEELYDHTTDPNEWTNLASKPELAAVKKELAAALPKTNAPDAPTQAEARNARAKGKK